MRKNLRPSRAARKASRSMSVVLPVPLVPTISRERLCMSRGTTTRPRLSVQPRSPSTWTPRATGPKWSSRTAGGPAHGRLHAAGGLALAALDLGRVDGLPAAGQVQRGGEQPDRDGQGELGPQERPGRRVVELGGADLAQPAGIAGEVLGQGRPRPTLDHDHRGDGGQGGEGELPPAQAGDAQQCLAGGPGQQGDRAEQEQGQGDAHGELAGGGWAAGGEAVAELVVVQRPAGMPPAPGGPVPAPARIVRGPAAPAPRVLGMPAHAASPPASQVADAGHLRQRLDRDLGPAAQLPHHAARAAPTAAACRAAGT